jgi:hypothetical protein
VNNKFCLCPSDLVFDGHKKMIFQNFHDCPIVLPSKAVLMKLQKLFYKKIPCNFLERNEGSI